MNNQQKDYFFTFTFCIVTLSLLLSLFFPNFAYTDYSENQHIITEVEFTVYITNTGTHFHTSSCHYIKYSSHSISMSDAISKGYSVCSICNPKIAFQNTKIKCIIIYIIIPILAIYTLMDSIIIYLFKHFQKRISKPFSLLFSIGVWIISDIILMIIHLKSGLLWVIFTELIFIKKICYKSNETIKSKKENNQKSFTDIFCIISIIIGILISIIMIVIVSINILNKSPVDDYNSSTTIEESSFNFPIGVIAIGNPGSDVYHTHDCGHLPNVERWVYYYSIDDALYAGRQICVFCSEDK